MKSFFLIALTLISVKSFADSSQSAVIECNFKVKKAPMFKVQIQDVLAEKTDIYVIQKGVRPSKFHVTGNVGTPESSYYLSDDKTFELGYVPYTTDYVEGRLGKDAFTCKSASDGNEVISL